VWFSPPRKYCELRGRPAAGVPEGPPGRVGLTAGRVAGGGIWGCGLHPPENIVGRCGGALPRTAHDHEGEEELGAVGGFACWGCVVGGWVAGGYLVVGVRVELRRGIRSRCQARAEPMSRERNGSGSGRRTVDRRNTSRGHGVPAVPQGGLNGLRRLCATGAGHIRPRRHSPEDRHRGGSSPRYTSKSITELGSVTLCIAMSALVGVIRSEVLSLHLVV
jgi:hypothetical protein